jgi:hypothetical protein
MAIRAAIDRPNTPETPWIGRVLKINPGTVKPTRSPAISRAEPPLRKRASSSTAKRWLNPALLRARAELGVNLMRLGQDEEARWHLSTASTAATNTPA